MTETSNQQLIRTAIKGRWPIRPSTRIKIIEETEQILDNKESDPKLKLLAARTIVQMDSLNLKEEEIRLSQLPKHHIHTNMTTEELKAAIQEKIKSMELDMGQVPEAGIKALLESKNESSNFG